MSGRINGTIGVMLILAALLLGSALAAWGTPPADVHIANALAPWRRQSGFWSAISMLGDTEIRLGIVALLILALFAWGRRLDALLLGVTITAGMGINSLLKLLFSRPRPDLMPHLDTVMSLSFPSGHAAHSATLYLLIALFAGSMTHGSKTQVAIVSVAAVLIMLIGLSRVVLGVHWPSDVLAGWAVGTGFAMIGWNMRTRMIRLADYRPHPQPRL